MHLREQVLQFQIRVCGERLSVNVDYILSSGHDSLLGTMGWMQVQRMQLEDIAGPGQIAHHMMMRHRITCVHGPAGSGKSHILAAAMKQANVQLPIVCAAVNEAFTAADLITHLSDAVIRDSASPRIQLLVSAMLLWQVWTTCCFGC